MTDNFTKGKKNEIIYVWAAVSQRLLASMHRVRGR